jgi:succinate-semialdehyde dehydrogenase/glutarate-semialdehyde dehydrogenase
MDARSPSSAFAGTRWSRQRLDALTDAVEPPDGDDDPIRVHAPAVGDPLGTVPRLTEPGVERAVSRCREAAADWRERTPRERAAVLDRFAALVETHRKELIDLVQLETGKARRHAFEEVLELPLTASYYARRAPELLARERRESAVPLVTTAAVEYDPVGVVGIISPWNYPLTLSMTDAIPALVAGNGVVLKPDEKTPFVALRLAELWLEAGLPTDVLAVVTGEGPVVGPALIDRVDYVTFTGSTETGRTVAERAGRNLIDCSLELSGKNPMLVCADADPGTAARGAVQGCFTNAGQLCLTTEQIYVEQPLFESFLDRFVSATESLALGATFDYGPDVGSLIDGEQLARVESHVADAVERGGTVEVGGRHRDDVGPYFYEPTVLTGVPEESVAVCEETFGPVVTVEPVASVEAAIERASDASHGLNASVWTGERERGERLASALSYGTVCVNDTYAAGWAALDAPMGGVRDSGIGRRHGPEGLRRYVEPKTVASSRIGPVDEPPFLPRTWFVRAVTALAALQRRVRRRFA